MVWIDVVRACSSSFAWEIDDRWLGTALDNIVVYLRHDIFINWNIGVYNSSRESSDGRRRGVKDYREEDLWNDGDIEGIFEEKYF